MKRKPHINIGVIGGGQRHFSILAALESFSAMAGSPPPGETAFSRLSEAAQDLIVSALLGEFDETGVPEMAPEVRAELEQWASETREDKNPILP